MNCFPLVLILVIGGVAAAIWAVASYLDKKRRERVVAIAKELDLELNWRLPDQDQGIFGQFQVVDRGRAKTTSLSLVADDGQTRITLFDYSFVTGSGKNQQKHNWVVSLCRSEDIVAPSMQLKPASLFSFFGSLLGFQDIDIPDAPEFSKAFVIQGEDPESIRKFLDLPRREAFLRKPYQTYGTRGRYLLIVRERQKLDAPNIKPLLSESLALVQALSKAQA